MTSILDHSPTNPDSRERRSNVRGFTLIELLVGMTILTVGLLAIAAMFPMGYLVVADAGKMTMTLTGTRQILEDIRSIPFNNLANLDGFDTTSLATLPANQPERELARRWRYALAGEGQGFIFTATEKSQWGVLSTTSSNMTASFGARGRIAVTSPTATTRLVTVTMTVPGRANNITIATLISRM